MGDERINRLLEETINRRYSRRQVMRRAAALGLTVPAISMLLAACGGDDDDEPEAEATNTQGATEANTPEPDPTEPAVTEPAATEPPESEATATESDAAEEATEEPPVEEPTEAPTEAPQSNLAEDQILQVSIIAEPANIDPNINRGSGSTAIVRLVFDTLLTFDAESELAPRAAIEVPTVENGGISADGMTYTVNLYEDAMFSDGTPATAEHWIYSMQRLLNPLTASPYASFFYPLTGAEEFNTSAESDAAALEELANSVGISADGDYTLTFTLTQPSAPFVQALALESFVPLHQTAIDAGGDQWTEPATYIGNGPFVLTEWAHQQQMTFGPNPNYSGTAPTLQTLVIKMIGEAAQYWNAYKVDELDISSVPRPNIAEVLTTPDLAEQLVREGSLGTTGIQFNVQRAPFDNPDFRRAFAFAINREVFVEQIEGGVGIPAYSWIPDGMPGHLPELGTDLAFDPEAAAELFAQVAAELPEMRLTYANVGSFPQRAQYVQESLRQAFGIEIGLDPLETGVANENVRAGNYDMTFRGWRGAYPDPDAWLSPVFGTGAGNNTSGYSNPEFDEIVAQAQVELDPEARLELWNEAQTIVIEDAVMIPYVFAEVFTVVKPWVKGLTIYPTDPVLSMAGSPRYHEVYIEEQ